VAITRRRACEGLKRPPVLLHLNHEIQKMVSSIIQSLSSLVPTLLLLTMMIYTLSILFTQLAIQSGERTDEVIYWFGNIPRTSLTLLEAIAGGVSWDEPCMVVFDNVGIFGTVVFVFYISTGVFVMLNVIMGVFIDKAIKVAGEKDELDLACAISGAFIGGEHLSAEDNFEITWDVFSQKLQEPELQKCFETLNIDIAQANILFDLIDTDQSGQVDAQEIVEGCLRLKGTAKALDTSMMLQVLNQLIGKVEQHMTRLDGQIKTIDQRVNAFGLKLGLGSLGKSLTARESELRGEFRSTSCAI